MFALTETEFNRAFGIKEDKWPRYSEGLTSLQGFGMAPVKAEGAVVGYASLMRQKQKTTYEKWRNL